MFFKKQCFAVFCGVLFLWCFEVFHVRVFSDFHKTAQNRPKSIQNAQNEQNTLLCNTAQYGAVHLVLTQKMSKKTFAKHVQNIAKHSQKHRKTLFFKKHWQNTTKHPQNTHKTPQNTAKHHKRHLLTKQTELANKPLRSPSEIVDSTPYLLLPR